MKSLRFLLLLFLAFPVFFVSCGKKAEKPFIPREEFVGTWKFENTNEKTPIFLMAIGGFKLTFRFEPDGNAILIAKPKPYSTAYSWEIQGKYLHLPFWIVS